MKKVYKKTVSKDTVFYNYDIMNILRKLSKIILTFARYGENLSPAVKNEPPT